MHLTTDAKQQDMKQRRASRGCSATVLSYVYFGEGGTRGKLLEYHHKNYITMYI